MLSKSYYYAQEGNPFADSSLDRDGSGVWGSAWNIMQAEAIFEVLYDEGKIDAPWIADFEGGLDNREFNIYYEFGSTLNSRPTANASNGTFDTPGITIWNPALGVSLRGAVWLIGHEYQHSSPHNRGLWGTGNLLGGQRTSRGREFQNSAQTDANNFGDSVLRAYDENKGQFPF